MPISLSFDRLEGSGKEIAVLLTEEGDAIHLPRSLLSDDAKPGDVLTLTLARDAEGSRRLSDATRQLQNKLSQRDPGGDIKL
jgi:hypothetical protein